MFRGYKISYETTHHLILTVSQKNKTIININCYDNDWDYETIARFVPLYNETLWC